MFDAASLGVTATLDGRTVSGAFQREFLLQDDVESCGPALRVFSSALVNPGDSSDELMHGDPVVIVSEVDGAGAYTVKSIERGRDGIFAVVMLEDLA